MSNFLKEVKQGIDGKNQSLPGKFKRWHKKIGTLYKKRIYLLGASTKTGKTSFLDEVFVLYPFLNKPKHIKIQWIYFSYEIDLIEKMAAYCAYFMMYKYKIRCSAEYILGRMEDKPTLGEFELIKEIYNNELTQLFGEYNENGKRISDGMIDFHEDKQNPTGIYKYLMNYASENGEFIYEKFEISSKTGVGTSGKKEGKRKVGYIEKDENLWTIVIIDHVGLVKGERGFTKKQNLDKLSSYLVELRNFCKFTFIPVSQFNRGLGKIDRLKFSGDLLQPTLDDYKDTGNLAEDSNMVIGLFNPSFFPHLNEHLGYDLDKFQKLYRSAHILVNRNGESALNYGFLFDPLPKRWVELPLPDEKIKVEVWEKRAEKLLENM